MSKKSIIKSSEGFGLVEVMVSSVIIMFVMTASMTTIRAGRTSQAQLKTVNACEAVIRSAKEGLTSLGADIYMQVDPVESYFMFNGNDFDGRLLHTDSFAEDQTGVLKSHRWPTNVNYGLYSLPATYGDRLILRKNRLYMNSINALSSIYNTNRTRYCINDEDASSSADPYLGYHTYTGTANGSDKRLFPTGTLGNLQNVETRIRIEPYLLSTGERSTLSNHRCRNRFTPVPKRLNTTFNNNETNNLRVANLYNFSQTSGGIPLHYSEYGLRLKLLVTYDNPQTEKTETCRGSMDFSYPAKTTPPTAPQNNVAGNIIDTNGLENFIDVPSSSDDEADDVSGGLPTTGLYNADATLRRGPVNTCTAITAPSNLRDLTVTYTISAAQRANGHTLLCRDASRQVDLSDSAFTTGIDCRSSGAVTASVASSGMVIDSDNAAIRDTSALIPGVIRPKRYYENATSGVVGSGDDLGWVPCDSVKVCGKEPTGTPTLTPVSSPNTLTVSYDDLPQACLARIEYAVADEAGNISDIQRIERIMEANTCGELCDRVDYIATATDSEDFYQCGSCAPCDNVCDPSSSCALTPFSAAWNAAGCGFTCTDNPSSIDPNAVACTDNMTLTADSTFVSESHGCQGNNNSCDWQCDSGFYWTGSACNPVGSCTGTPPDVNGIACSHSGVIAAKPYRAAQGCASGDVCDWECAPGFGWDGSSCVAFSCNSGTLPSGGRACGVTGLTADQDYRAAQGCVGTADVCDWECDTPGYTWNATTMTCDGPACTGSTPANADLCLDGPAVTTNTPRTLRASCDPAIRCDYECASGYHLSGGICVANSCDSSTLPGAAASRTACVNVPYPATNNASYVYASGNTCSVTNSCDFTCNSGYSWDAGAGECTAAPTGPLCTSGTMVGGQYGYSESDGCSDSGACGGEKNEDYEGVGCLDGGHSECHPTTVQICGHTVDSFILEEKTSGSGGSTTVDERQLQFSLAGTCTSGSGVTKLWLNGVELDVNGCSASWEAPPIGSDITIAEFNSMGLFGNFDVDYECQSGSSENSCEQAGGAASCTGSVPSSATACTGGAAPSTDTAYSHTATCSASTVCGFTCSGSTPNWNGTACVAGTPSHGQCGSALHSCAAGTYCGGGNTGGTSYWTCCGSNGGTNASCSGSSFVAGTSINTPSGKVNIEDLDVGDYVVGSKGLNQILKLKRRVHKGRVYSINGSDYFVTPGHPFMTDNGWKAFDEVLAKQLNPDLDIGRLKIGDILIREDGVEEPLVAYDFEDQEVPVYNFEVSGTRDYYADGYWVHNK